MIGFSWCSGVDGCVVVCCPAEGGYSEPTSPEIDCPDPFVDECGVRHFWGDAYDLPNHPTPGAHGRVEVWSVALLLAPPTLWQHRYTS